MVIVDEKYSFLRNLVGYGQQGLDCEWPKGTRIAVSFCINYEEGAESTILNGDSGSETHNWEKSGGAPFVGSRHTNVERDYEYGSRTGMWRLLRVFSQFNYPVTCFAVEQALEKNPDVAKACIAEGHEIGGHGYRWIDYKDWAPEDEKASIKRCIEAMY